MQAPIAPVSAAQTAPPAVSQPDMRPTADAAALAKNPTPNIPLPLPASMAPVAAVNQSRLSELTSEIDPIAQVERTLKPYGVTMLPHGPAGAEGGQTSPDDAPTPDDTD